MIHVRCMLHAVPILYPAPPPGPILPSSCPPQATEAHPALPVLLAHGRLAPSLRQGMLTLEAVAANLDSYLDCKRRACPRLYFLADEELIAVVKHHPSDGPLPHLHRVFEGARQLEVSPDGAQVVAMQGAHRERILFGATVQPLAKANKGQSERWLNDVEHEMRAALRGALGQALAAHPGAQAPEEGVRLLLASREEWALDWACQVALAAQSVVWTAHTEAAIVAQQGLARLQEGTQAALHSLAGALRGRLAAVARVTLGSLLCNDSHSHEVVQQLAQARVAELGAFAWAQELRLYRDEEGPSKGAGLGVLSHTTHAHVPLSQLRGPTPHAPRSPLGCCIVRCPLGPSTQARPPGSYTRGSRRGPTSPCWGPWTPMQQPPFKDPPPYPLQAPPP